MYVSNEVRRRELPESTPDSTPYASAAAGASFMAILSEVAAPTEKSTDVEPPEEPSNVADVAEVSEPESRATEKPGSEATPAAKEPTEEGKITDSTDTPAEDTVAEAGEVATPSATTNPATATAPATGTVGAPTTGATEVGAVSTEAVADVLADSTTVDGEATGLADLSPTPPQAETDAATPAESVVESPVNAVDSLSAVADSSAEVAPTSPVETFPKTLNAIIAEGALRQSAEKTEETSDLPTDAEELIKAAIEPPGDLPAPEIPESPPAPHAAALEAGGVRPQATGTPRLPMANLPGELAQQIHLMQQEGTRTMRLTLVPEHLGELQIEIQGTGDSMRVRLISGNPAVRDALESQMGSLKDALQKQGLALDNATVDSGAPRREAAPEQERRASTPYRETTLTRESAVTGIRASTPLALGSGALNILA
ncbi:MAG: flagellar hook-length control protein FliK [Candidatus Hydrogenedentes bacterium]|nr:flagellar hook-length control protein FliK [Candidatus Hydrogenedentota bacterium]